MTLSPDVIRERILQELYRRTGDSRKPVDMIALAAKVAVDWPDATTQVTALRREGLIERVGFEWTIMLTRKGQRRCRAEFGEPGNSADGPWPQGSAAVGER